MKNEYVGYLSAVGCGVWCTVYYGTMLAGILPTFLQTLYTNTPQPTADKQPTCSFFTVLLLYLKKGLNPPKSHLVYCLIKQALFLTLIW